MFFSIMKYMNPVAQFFVNNFALIIITAAMTFICVQNLRVRRRESFLCIAIVAQTLFLAVLTFLEIHGKDNGILVLSTICCGLGYIIRPITIFTFVRLADSKIHKVKPIFYIPLLINLLAYIPGFVIYSEELTHVVFYYTVNMDGTLLFNRGSVLNFTAHVVSALYLGYLLYVSFKKLKGKHISHGVTVLICAFFAVMAVVIESIFSNKNISVLNETIAISALLYYLFLFSERTRCDPLTGLFNREMYYNDVKKMDRSINGVIQLDMNGLKYINDNFGHEAGDKAIKTVASILEESMKRNMYLYRLGGDEFTILIVNGNESEIVETCYVIREKLEKEKYYCSIGYAIKPVRDCPLDDMLKEAEEMMYKDKEDFYLSGKLERRKR